MKEQYIAEDGKIFNAKEDCARHELKNCEGVLDKLERGVANSVRSHQTNWCGGGGSAGCACMGCINHAFYEIGLTKEHWQVWMNEFRKDIALGKEEGWDNSQDFTQTNVVLKNHGVNKAEVVKVIRQITGLGAVPAFKFAEPDSQIKIAIAYIDAKVYKNQLEKAGATVDVVEYRPYIKVKSKII